MLPLRSPIALQMVGRGEEGYSVLGEGREGEREREMERGRGREGERGEREGDRKREGEGGERSEGRGRGPCTVLEHLRAFESLVLLPFFPPNSVN